MTRGGIKTEVLVRLNRDTTTAFTETILNNFIDQSHRWASSYKTWPFAEGRVSTTYASTTEEWDFEGYLADTFRFVQVGGKRLQKINFEDYQIFREERSSAKDRVFSDYGGLVFINPNIDASGTLTAWGRFMPANVGDGDSNDTVETVFSEGNDEGNQAIIEETLSYSLNRFGNAQEALVHHNLAIQHLDRLWDRVQKEQFVYQRKDQNLFKRFDIMEGTFGESRLKRDQFY